MLIASNFGQDVTWLFNKTGKILCGFGIYLLIHIQVATGTGLGQSTLDVSAWFLFKFDLLMKITRYDIR